jgi:peptidoglycan/xylan/chitin deacetylase (PgdA/CDA1 family)
MSMFTRSFRFFFTIAAAAALFACGGLPEQSIHNSPRDVGLDLGIGPGPICVGPACLGQHLESVTLAPVEPPSIPSTPLGPIAPPPVPLPAPPICLTPTTAMQMLVISADGTEPSLPAIQQALGFHTIPFTTWIAKQNPGMLTADKLATGCDGKYQGVILATGGLVYSPDGLTWASALTAPEWLALRSYEASFKVREISWYVFPGADEGLNPPTAGLDTSAVPINATLTAAGQNVFPTVNAANPVPISMAWTYLATPADPNVTPLLVDALGNALVSSRVTSDGRETMALTFDSNQWLIHDLVLAHGLVEWVTKGIYLGEFRAYTLAQIDDLLIDDDMYLGGAFRMTDADFNATRAWQASQKVNAGPNFRLAWAFNAFGAGDDSLTTAARTYSNEFHWISHTWDHTNLDNMTYDQAFREFDLNDKFAKSQGYQNYSTKNIVQPEVSGLGNAAALKAAWDVGIRYTISDTSRVGWDNPAPNIAIYSTLQAGMLHIPRKPTNLFYNVSTPQEWAAEYNMLYTAYWGRALSYAEILDKESQNLLVYLLQGNIDPTMYHQPNTRAYDGTHTLLGDLLDVAFKKFRRHSTLPIVSLDQDACGVRMANTMARNKAGVVATVTPGVKVSFSSPVAVEFAFTGVCTSSSERYGGRCITNVKVGAGQTVTFLLI